MLQHNRLVTSTLLMAVFVDRKILPIRTRTSACQRVAVELGCALIIAANVLCTGVFDEWRWNVKGMTMRSEPMGRERAI